MTGGADPGPEPGPSPGPSLSLRVFWAMGLVVLAGAGTLVLVSALLAPAIFHRHLHQAGIPQDPAVTTHVEEGFAVALLVSTLVGVLAATAVAAAGALLVARRISGPITVIARTTGELATGDYSARVSPPRMGPELADLADSVNALAGRLEATEQIRIRLMTDLAHELRTPLASIEATVEAVSDGVLPADGQTLSTLVDQTQRLTRLIDDLSAASRAEERAFHLDLESVDLIAVAQAAASSAAAQFAREGVQLNPPAGPEVRVQADPDRVREVVDQLLANALQHCQPGDEVTISGCNEGARGVLTVADTGAGFPPADHELLFQRFYRADRGRSSTGTGIGLTIARALIAAQAGTLAAHSDGPGTGATFTVGLPRSSG
jgi:two-component system, OmpR family, sensor histidine kinase BaeS